jgi:hypothetical protein
MPLKKGKSKKVIAENIREVVKSYNKTGKIGTSNPANKKKAIKQAIAIAIQKAHKNKKRGKR